MHIEFSKYNFRTKSENNIRYIFDIIRKKYVVLTPEEWVRQHIVHYLLYDHQFPKSLISLEKKLTLNELTKRTDIVLYNQKGEPVLIVECKAESVALTQKTFEQIARYNLTLSVPFLWVSNGNVNHLCRIDHTLKKFTFLDTLPSLSELI
ncbi:MAG: type I restriction enzyme HsdR N-terminal domain-containing protein [Chitinophagales bacterium]|nr:type I restriction enzyme HsdR N-terminal domain-containing protein [Bacteroidota bacterium]MBK7567817.1 type I restriction enzyme HsdR N-terminal domain-containing protein [Bacteroidota bacterium]MBP9221110.1 type I restriction enzyme HsdR N-terminal domain-containing protein [Chitinophagales bacterium]